MNPDEQREYQRQWMRTYRRLIRQKHQAMAAAKFTLHDYSCPYPEKGCRCKAIVVSDAPLA